VFEKEDHDFHMLVGLVCVYIALALGLFFLDDAWHSQSHNQRPTCKESP
jgi:hypothetical protein